MKICAVVKAWMGISSLARNVLMDLGGAAVLDRVLNRLGRSELIHELLVATTVEPADDAIVEHCKRTGRKVFRGSEQDVLDRYYHAAKYIDADVAVRITSDCPVIDPDVTDATIRGFFDQHADYASNALVRTYPRGLDTEVMTVRALERAWRESTKPYQREHVTPYIYENPSQFKLHGIENDVDSSRHRWTLDTPEDLQLLRAIYERFGGRADFTCPQLLQAMQHHPSLPTLNPHLVPKPVHQG